MNIKLADRLVALRKENNLSQEALAEKLGLSRQSISKWERAEASPDTDNLIALAEVYGITLDALLGNEDVKPDPAETENVAEPAKRQKVKKGKKELTDKQIKGKKRVLLFPLLLIASVAVYAVGGLTIGGLWWSMMWVLFPLSLAYAFTGGVLYFSDKKLISVFLSAVAAILFAVSVYIVLGMAFKLWAIAWIVFLAIPAYIYVAAIKK